MATRQFTKLEQVGILVGVVIIGLFFYLRLFYTDASRRLKRAETEWVKISSEVNRLKTEAESGRVQRTISTLRKRINSAEQDLEKLEVRLAGDGEIDALANQIVRTAAEGGLRINEFRRIKDRKTIEKVTNGEEVYRQKYYKIALQGKFRSLRAFLEKVNQFPKLIALRSIAIEKPEDEDLLEAELWLSI
jgi:Tfp pilus assembly protein PilO